MTTTKEEIGGRIKLALVAAGLTQRALSKSLSVGESAVSAYVQGAAEPSADGFATIATLCKTTTDWLITGAGLGPGEAAGVAERHSAYAHKKSANAAVTLRAVIEGVEEYLQLSDLELQPSKKADLIITLYEMCMEEGKQVDKATIVRLVRLAA